jgi:type 1 glutamine amidotransferase
MLQLTAAAVAAGPGAFRKILADEPGPRKRLLFFTKSSGFEHQVVKREDGQPAFAERVMQDFADQAGFDIEISKDGTLFDQPLDRFDAFFFYTTGDLTTAGTDGQPPMSQAGKSALLKAIADGKGFCGSHCASDTFHSPGEQWKNQETAAIDPFIEMLGGEFISHGEQQQAIMRLVSEQFPGLAELGREFSLHEEWYSLKNYTPDLHVVLLQETAGMKNRDYQRPPFPATWARRHHNGRVFYTSMGHREDIWTNKIFQAYLGVGLAWALGSLDVDVPPNLAEVSPGATTLPA